MSREHELPKLNHVVLHRYMDGEDTIGMHHDKYMDIAPGSTIVSSPLARRVISCCSMAVGSVSVQCRVR